jgi:hypothetical protein
MNKKRLVITTAPAPADHRSKGHVTKSEFRQVCPGMPMHTAHRILGMKGRQSSYCPGAPSLGFKAEQARQYKTAKRCGAVDIAYYKVNGVWMVKAKDAFWG